MRSTRWVCTHTNALIDATPEVKSLCGRPCYVAPSLYSASFWRKFTSAQSKLAIQSMTPSHSHFFPHRKKVACIIYNPMTLCLRGSVTVRSLACVEHGHVISKCFPPHRPHQFHTSSALLYPNAIRPMLHTRSAHPSETVSAAPVPSIWH